MAYTYAPTAANWAVVSCAPPIGGMTPVCAFGLGTPCRIVRTMEA